MTQDPWRDPEYYKRGPITKCLGCGKGCHKTYWGPWCLECNVKRIEPITKKLEDLLK